MNGKQLKNSILQWAIQGKLVPQDPNDEPASVLLDKIRQEKERLIKEKKIKRDKNASIIYRGEDNSYYEKILATGEVKCIDEEVPFEIPQGWEWCRLRDVIQLLSGRDLEPSMYNSSPKGIPYITGASNFNNENLIVNRWTQTPVTVSEEGDLLITCKGTIGTMAFNNIGSIHIARQIMAIHSKDVDLHYLKLYFELNIGTLESQANSMIPGISREVVLNSLVPIPPLQEQIKIVGKSNSLMPLVSKYSFAQGKLNLLNNVIKNKLEKTILQEAIKGKLVPQLAEEGTAQELLEQIKTEKQELVKAGKLKKSSLNDSVIFRGDDNKYYELIGKKCWDITEQIPFEIPSNWEWCRVRNVSNSYIGLTYKPTDIDEKGTIVLRSCNIRNGKLVLDDIVRVSSSISEKLLIEENDIIICARNGSKRLVGKSALIRNLTEPMTFGAFMAICKTPIYEYMFAYLQSDLFFGQLRDVSNTTTINQLTQNKFNDFLIPIPPVKEQERIAFKISQLFQELR